MPNHIQCRLLFKGEDAQIAQIREHIKGTYDDGSEMQIDFNKIKKCPDGLNMQVCSHIVDMSNKTMDVPTSDNPLLGALEEMNRARLKSPQTLDDAQWKQYIQCLQNLRDTGHAYWYTWNIENWGTKWNAYNQNDKRTTNDAIYFQTAWSAPISLIDVLSKMFPNVHMCLTYADEDTGSNTGVIEYLSGIKTEYYPKSQSKEAYEIYFDMHPNDKDNYKLVGQTYEYIEQDI